MKYAAECIKLPNRRVMLCRWENKEYLIQFVRLYSDDCGFVNGSGVTVKKSRSGSYGTVTVSLGLSFGATVALWRLLTRDATRTTQELKEMYDIGACLIMKQPDPAHD